MTSTQPAPTPPDAPARGTLLVVEDEDALRRAFARILEGAGYTVVQAADGMLAVEAVMQQQFDLILTDITMPGMTGIQLLRQVREHDPDVPVVLITANPDVESAALAVELRALKYLIKPIAPDDLIAMADQAVKVGKLARFRRDLYSSAESTNTLMLDRASLNKTLTRAIKSIRMVYQPIVNWQAREVIAYEALVRTDDTDLPYPDALLGAAKRLGRIEEVSRVIRQKVAQDLRVYPRTGDVFVNLHPADLMDEELYSATGPLAEYARQIVFEITEREGLNDAANIPKRAARLRKLGYRIAIDDLGAGYSGLDYFARLTPEVAKIDISLVRDVHIEEVKQKLVASLITLCKELGVKVVAEGVEQPAERDKLAELGCDLFQGYLFAKPGKPYPEASW